MLRPLELDSASSAANLTPAGEQMCRDYLNGLAINYNTPGDEWMPDNYLPECAFSVSQINCTTRHCADYGGGNPVFISNAGGNLTDQHRLYLTCSGPDSMSIWPAGGVAHQYLTATEWQDLCTRPIGWGDGENKKWSAQWGFVHPLGGWDWRPDGPTEFSNLCEQPAVPVTYKAHLGATNWIENYELGGSASAAFHGFITLIPVY